MEPEYALITHNVASMRAEPDRRAEQISQTLWGETVRVLETRETFARVETPDAYQGWIMRRHLGPVPNAEDQSAEIVTHYTVAELIVNVYAQDAPQTTVLTKLVFGTRIAVPAAPFGTPPAYVPVEIVAPGTYASQHGTVFTDSLLADADRPAFSPQSACEWAQKFVGTPYLWGGVTPFGFDCSGFVQRIFAFLGILLPRDAYQQAMSPLGTVLPNDAPLQPADLVFFGRPDALPDAPRNNIVHVAMMLDAERMIHAYGRDGVIVSSLVDSEIAEVFLRRGSWRYSFD